MGIDCGVDLPGPDGAGWVGTRLRRGEEMLYEVEVVSQGNSPMDLNRVFDLLTEPKPITRVFTADPLNQDVWCQVTGWGVAGPSTAYSALAEDSGEGVILLIYGGDDGIRLKREEDPAEWALENGGQWGEPCLMLGKDTPVS